MQQAAKSTIPVKNEKSSVESYGESRKVKKARTSVRNSLEPMVHEKKRVDVSEEA